MPRIIQSDEMDLMRKSGTVSVKDNSETQELLLLNAINKRLTEMTNSQELLLLNNIDKRLVQMNSKPIKWVFTIHRDTDGFITEIIGSKEQ